MRTPSKAALALLTHFEQGPNGGFAPFVYRDWAGHETIGWGHRLRPGESFPTPIDEAMANTLLGWDLERIALSIDATLGELLPVTQSMFDAICCWAFNVGLDAALGSTLITQLKAREWFAAADEFLRWNRATNPETGEQEPLAGLPRRKVERDLFLREGVPG